MRISLQSAVAVGATACMAAMLMSAPAHADDSCRTTGPADFNYGYKTNPCMRVLSNGVYGYANYWNGGTDVRMYVEVGRQRAPYGQGSGPVYWLDSTTANAVTYRGRDGSYLGYVQSYMPDFQLGTCFYARTWMTNAGKPYNEAESGPVCFGGTPSW